MSTPTPVPDALTVDMVRLRLAERDTREGFILDGFPRTVQQADALALMLTESGLALDTVVEFTAPEDVVVGRLLGRGREDDTAEVIRHRQRIHHSETAPLLAYYADLLPTVHAVGATEDIAAELVTSLACRVR